jgi:hypothetical protein
MILVRSQDRHPRIYHTPLVMHDALPSSIMRGRGDMVTRFILLPSAVAYAMRCRCDHRIKHADAASGMAAMLQEKAQNRFCLMVLKVSRDSRSEAESASWRHLFRRRHDDRGRNELARRLSSISNRVLLNPLSKPERM